MIYDKSKLDIIQNRINLFHFQKITLEDLRLLTNPNLDTDQMELIYEGLQANLDISKYADPVFNYKQMKVIFDGLKDGLDVIKYANPEFSWNQMLN